MQILQGGTKLKKFYLSYCSVLNHEMDELKNLMKQTPNILPNIISITWIDWVQSVDWDDEHRKSLLETFKHTFPHAKVRGNGQ
jgi:hypothetical protein